MGPYVIDQKKRQEYFLFLIFFIAISFALGYFFGYQNGQLDPQVDAAKPVLSNNLTTMPETAAGIDEKSTELNNVDAKKKLVTPEAENNTNKKSTESKKSKNTKISAKPKPKSTAKSVQKPKPKPKRQVAQKPKPTPVVKKVSKPRPVVKPTPQISDAKSTQKQQTQNTSNSSKLVSTTNNDIAINTGGVANSVANKNDDLKTLSPVTNIQSTAGSSQSQPANIDASTSAQKIISDTSVTEKGSSLLNEVIPKKSYSIQVGMFGSKRNAEKFISQLQQDGFRVYLAAFVSSAGGEHFNVRLGPYSQRDTANENMKMYKISYSTPAYIVINK